MTTSLPQASSRDRADLLGTKKRAVLFLRWVVIIATSYLLLFASGGRSAGVAIPALVLFFLVTNVVAGLLPAEAFERQSLQALFVALDTVVISAGMMLSGQNTTDLFLMYFSVLFLAALGEDLAMIAGGSALVVFLYLLVLLKTRPERDLLTPAVLLRVPFLFGIGIFYGYLVELAKKERRRAETALEHERFRTDFLATLTHDLQSPLSAIAGFAELLLSAPIEAAMAEYRAIFGAIKRGASESADLVANFLALARGEAQPRPRRQMIHLNALAEEVAHLHLPAASAKEVSIVTRLAPELPPIAGERVQIRRAVANLVANAVKFTPPGGRIEIETARDGFAVSLSVTDTGPGIAAEAEAQLFERYARGDGEAAGTGLGLFIVRLVAEAHGGAASVHSAPGRGARFTLRLPLPPELAVGDSRRAAEIGGGAGIAEARNPGENALDGFAGTPGVVAAPASVGRIQGRS